MQSTQCALRSILENDTLLHFDAEVSFVVFNQDTDLFMNWCPIRDPRTLQHVNALSTYVDGSTNLYSAVILSVQHLLQDRDDLIHRHGVPSTDIFSYLVVLTDGEDTSRNSPQDARSALQSLSTRKGVHSRVVFVGNSAGFDSVKAMCDKTNTKVCHAAEDVIKQELIRIIVEEIKQITTTTTTVTEVITTVDNSALAAKDAAIQELAAKEMVMRLEVAKAQASLEEKNGAISVKDREIAALTAKESEVRAQAAKTQQELQAKDGAMTALMEKEAATRAQAAKTQQELQEKDGAMTALMEKEAATRALAARTTAELSAKDDAMRALAEKEATTRANAKSALIGAAVIGVAAVGITGAVAYFAGRSDGPPPPAPLSGAAGAKNLETLQNPHSSLTNRLQISNNTDKPLGVYSHYLNSGKVHFANWVFEGSHCDGKTHEIMEVVIPPQTTVTGYCTSAFSGCLCLKSSTHWYYVAASNPVVGSAKAAVWCRTHADDDMSCYECYRVMDGKVNTSRNCKAMCSGSGSRYNYVWDLRE